MSLLICTPCYGGMVHFPHYKSVLEPQSALDGSGLEYDFLVTTNESLIQRARNTMAAKFLGTEFRKMLFIDADIEFSPEDVARLWNLQTDVCAGVYPMKKMGAGYAAWKDGKLVESLDGLDVTEVDYAGTGFMMIDRSVFERMKTPEIRHEEGEVGECWAFFNPRVHEGVYLSEDYAFCHDWRAIGGKILMDTSVRLIHHGSYGYDGRPIGQVPADYAQG